MSTNSRDATDGDQSTREFAEPSPEDIYNVIFLFNKGGMCCRSVKGTEIKTKIRLTEGIIDQIIMACKRDILTREVKSKKEAKKVWKQMEMEKAWPKCAFMIDQDGKSWQIAANCTVEREATPEECALFITSALLSVVLMAE